MDLDQDVRLNINMTLLAAVLSALALLVSLTGAIQDWQEQDENERLRARLACLELPGANDCGLDGR